MPSGSPGEETPGIVNMFEAGLAGRDRRVPGRRRKCFTRGAGRAL